MQLPALSTLFFLEETVPPPTTHHIWIGSPLNHWFAQPPSGIKQNFAPGQSSNIFWANYLARLGKFGPVLYLALKFTVCTVQCFLKRGSKEFWLASSFEGHGSSLRSLPHPSNYPRTPLIWFEQQVLFFNCNDLTRVFIQLPSVITNYTRSSMFVSQ